MGRSDEIDAIWKFEWEQFSEESTLRGKTWDLWLWWNGFLFMGHGVDFEFDEDWNRIVSKVFDKKTGAKTRYKYIICVLYNE